MAGGLASALPPTNLPLYGAHQIIPTRALYCVVRPIVLCQRTRRHWRARLGKHTHTQAAIVNCARRMQMRWKKLGNDFKLWSGNFLFLFEILVFPMEKGGFLIDNERRTSENLSALSSERERVEAPEQLFSSAELR